MSKMGRFVAAVALVVVVCGGWSIVSRWIPSYVDYQGQKIKLTRYYLDYDDYKEDPDNIDPSETKRVQELVMSAHIDREFPDRKAAIRAAFDVKFPGYGAGGLGMQTLPGGDILTGLSVEIPRLDKDRYFVFRSHNGQYTLIDDFVASDMPLLTQMRVEDGNIVFIGIDQKPALTRKMNWK